MNIDLVLQNSLFFRSLLGLALSLLILASLYLNAEMWLGDYPPDIQEKYGDMGEKAKSQRIVVGILFFGALAGSVRRGGPISGAFPQYLHHVVVLQPGRPDNP